MRRAKSAQIDRVDALAEQFNSMLGPLDAYELSILLTLTLTTIAQHGAATWADMLTNTASAQQYARNNPL